MKKANTVSSLSLSVTKQVAVTFTSRVMLHLYTIDGKGNKCTLEEVAEVLLPERCNLSHGTLLRYIRHATVQGNIVVAGKYPRLVLGQPVVGYRLSRVQCLQDTPPLRGHSDRMSTSHTMWISPYTLIVGQKIGRAALNRIKVALKLRIKRAKTKKDYGNLSELKAFLTKLRELVKNNPARRDYILLGRHYGLPASSRIILRHDPDMMKYRQGSKKAAKCKSAKMKK